MDFEEQLKNAIIESKETISVIPFIILCYNFFDIDEMNPSKSEESKKQRITVLESICEIICSLNGKYNKIPSEIIEHIYNENDTGLYDLRIKDDKKFNEFMDKIIEHIGIENFELNDEQIKIPTNARVDGKTNFLNNYFYTKGPSKFIEEFKNIKFKNIDILNIKTNDSIFDMIFSNIIKNDENYKDLFINCLNYHFFSKSGMVDKDILINLTKIFKFMSKNEINIEDFPYYNKRFDYSNFVKINFITNDENVANYKYINDYVKNLIKLKKTNVIEIINNKSFIDFMNWNLVEPKILKSLVDNIDKKEINNFINHIGAKVKNENLVLFRNNIALEEKKVILSNIESNESLKKYISKKRI